VTIIHEWKESDHIVQLYASGKCAVVTYFFSITFAIGTEKQTMQGRDMVFLVKKGRRWLVAADQFSPEPAETDLHDREQARQFLPV
jgi:ketosteroid isomerase-like protein